MRPGFQSYNPSDASCVADGFCLVVGTVVVHDDEFQSFVDVLDGARTVRQLTFTDGDQPRSVSCATRRFCALVGTRSVSIWDGTDLHRRPLSEAWPGYAFTGESEASLAADVSCPAANFCMAVAPDRAWSWNGTAWTDQGARRPGIADVSCPTPTYCLAGGGIAFDRWDGTGWTPSPVASTAAGGVLVDDVTCWAPDACRASGTDIREPASPHEPSRFPWVKRWNGTAWQDETAATGGGAAPLSCSSASRCLGISYGDPLELDGTWSRTPPPPGDEALAALTALSCTPAWCLAAGPGYFGPGPVRAFAYRWTF